MNEMYAEDKAILKPQRDDSVIWESNIMLSIASFPNALYYSIELNFCFHQWEE
jgi:hypothetical protein